MSSGLLAVIVNGHTIYDQRFVDQVELQWYHEIYHARCPFSAEALFRMFITVGTG